MLRNAKWATFLLTALIFIFFLSGCASNQAAKSGDKPVGHASADGKIMIYTDLFPLYDFARQIGGDYVTVQSIVPPGAEPHDFEPSVRQMAEMNRADLFIYNGAGEEAWVERAIANLDPDKVKVVDASEGLPLLTNAPPHDQEVNRGEPEDGLPDAVRKEGGGGKNHFAGMSGVDPHLWLDPILAKTMAERILTALAELSPERKEAFQANYDKLAGELDALDADYREAVSKAERKKVVVAHAFLGYLAKRYGLEQIPISGFSPSDEPGQKEMMELVEIMKQNDIRYVAFDGLVENRLAQTVQREADAEAVTIHSIENVTKEQLEQGITYVQLMRQNLEALRKVLGAK